MRRTIFYGAAFLSLFCLGLVPPAFCLSKFRGVWHVHSRFSHDSSAGLDLIVSKARQIGLDFVVITDHNNLDGREAYREADLPNPPLLIFGNEISAQDGHLIALGIRNQPPKLPSQELVDWIHAEGGYAFLAHPFTPKNPWKDWKVERWDGLEIYDFGHSLLAGDVVDFAIRSLYESPKSLLDPLQEIPQEHLSFLDDLSKKKTVVMVAGTDAHLQKESKYAGFGLALRSVTLYVLAEGLTEPEIVKGIGSGRVFIVFETRGQAKDFSFWAEREGKVINLGETLDPGAPVTFHVHLPEPAQVRLLRDGLLLIERETQDLTFTAQEAGAYRVEVHRDGKPWIYSNPIYLKSSGV